MASDLRRIRLPDQSAPTGLRIGNRAGRHYGSVEQLSRYVPYMLHYIANRLSLGASRVFKERFQLTASEWRVLVIISASGKVTAAQASQLAGIDKSLASRIVRALKRRGLIEIGRSSEDSRARPLKMTASGDELFSRVHQVADARNYLLLSVLSDAEYETLQSLLFRLSSQVDIVNASEDIASGNRTLTKKSRRHKRTG